jgi:hypothetical protein
MDRREAADGDLDAPQSPDILAATQKFRMKCQNTIILGTDPFTTRSQEGGLPNGFPAELFVVNWDGTNFISREINVSAYTGESEDAVFAPLNLPSQPLQ